MNEKLHQALNGAPEWGAGAEEGEILMPPKQSVVITLTDNINEEGELASTIDVTLSEPISLATYNGDSPSFQITRDITRMLFYADPEGFKESFRAE